jgi:hypothetical protein
MHHDIAGIDQHPIAMREAFDPEIALACGLELLDQLFGDGADMPVRTPGGDNHGVRNSGFAVEIDGDDLFGLGVVKLGFDNLEKGGLCGPGLALRDELRLRCNFTRSGFLRCGFQGFCPLSGGRSSSDFWPVLHGLATQ